MDKILDWCLANLSATLGSFLIPFVAALCFTPLAIKFAHKRGLICHPRAERWSNRPTALFGGVAIFSSAALGWGFFLLPVSKELLAGVLAMILGATLMFLSGLYDDLKELTPAQKIVPQIVMACFFAAVFYRQCPPALVWLVPFAIVWIVGITNAINLLDNMDGLSAGVSMLCALLMAAHAAWMGDATVVVGALSIAGAAAGFLVFNFNPAKIFMGDCGSMFLGFSLACLSLMGQSGLLSGNLFSALLLPTLVLATPIFDTFFVAAVRFINGRPISLGGRDHTSHRLVLLGLSERRAVIWLYAITLWFGLIALWGSIIGSLWVTATVTAFSWVALTVLGIALAEVRAYSEEQYKKAHRARGEKAVLSRVIFYKRRVVETVLDFLAVLACWLAAYLLRYEGRLEHHFREMALLLPYVVACQMGAFHLTGLYQRLWRYVTISDLVDVMRGTVLGTVVAWFIAKFVGPVASNSVFIISCALTMLAVGGMRIALKALRFHFALKWRDGARRVLVVGAGDAGELAVREMLTNRELQLFPVGFVDDDPGKQRVTINGIKVLGTSSHLLDLIERHKVDEVIIALAGNQDICREVARICQVQGLDCREVRGLIV